MKYNGFKIIPNFHTDRRQEMVPRWLGPRGPQLKGVNKQMARLAWDHRRNS